MKKYYNAGSEIFTVDEVHNGNRNGTGDFDSFLEKLKGVLMSLGIAKEDLVPGQEDDGECTLDIPVYADQQGRAVCARLYPHEIYQQCLDYGYDRVMKSLKDQFCKQQKSLENLDLTGLDFSAGYDNLKKALIVRPLNYERHREKLQYGIYRKYGDVALVLYAVLKEEKGNLLTHMVDRQEVVLWGKKGREEEILSDALKRTSQRFPACIFCRNEAGSVRLMDGTYQREDIILPTGGIMLSSEYMMNGAAALFYPGVSAKIAELMHGKYAAVFMNTSDVMIVKPDSPHLNGFLDLAGSDDEFGEMLSEKKYLFDQKGRLINAEG